MLIEEIEPQAKFKITKICFVFMSVNHYDNYDMIMMMKIIMRSGVDMALSSEGQILTTSD